MDEDQTALRQLGINNAIYLAVKTGCLDNLKMLLEKTERETTGGISSPTLYAFVPLLARHGTLLHLTVVHIVRPLPWYSRWSVDRKRLVKEVQGKLNILRWLLDRGDLDLNAKDSEGNTALHLATEYVQEREDIEKLGLKALDLLLAKNNLNVNAVNSKGSTALHIACRREHSLAVASLTSRADLLVNAKDSSGDSALHLIARILHSHHTNVPGTVAMQLIQARGDMEPISGYEAAHYLLMDERTDILLRTADGLTARELAGDDWHLVSDLFQNHGKHCREAFGTYTRNTVSNILSDLGDCSIKYVFPYA